MFLYDVTSSYFEGSHNVLATWGYNRDKKNGKKQVVVGLLCDAQGDPVTVEVFAGNTSDPATLASAVRRAAQDFGGQRVTWVGDRGMIKSAQIADLHEKNFYYITAITKPQIETRLKAGSLPMSLFDEKVCEVAVDGVRYVRRRNPQRADEMARTRQGKQASLEKWLHDKNSYLAAHARAQVAVAVKHLQARMARLKVGGWLKAAVERRRLRLPVEAEALAQSSRLDGGYVIKTDLPLRRPGRPRWAAPA